MIRALSNAAGFVFTLVGHMLRIALWIASVAILGALAGIHPVTAVIFVVAVNLLGAMLYPMRTS